MRDINSELLTRLKKDFQTSYANADPRAVVWISRPTTALINNDFLEKQEILTGTAITDVSVAVCHPVIYRPVAKIYVGYVDNGTAHVKAAIAKTSMSAHAWIDAGFSETASAIALEFDGTMPKDRRGRVEFVTEELPWVFWINGGALYGKVLGDTEAVQLAAANATDVFSVRGMWSEVGGFDFGLVVFYILSGTIYYRQLIDGVWTDAEAIGFGPSATFVSIAAMRTWDYRICLQAQDDTGVLYELFTQYMGVAKQNVEHIEVKDVSAAGGMVHVDYTDTAEVEHIEVSNISVDSDLLSTIPAVPTSCQNIDDGTGNWGVTIIVTFTHRLSELSAGFYIQDANSITYAATASIIEDDGRTITFTVVDFNAAEGQTCTFCYTPGATISEAVDLEAFSFEFTPTNLVAPNILAPEVEAIWNE
jgi:hypothetical protein